MLRTFRPLPRFALAAAALVLTNRMPAQRPAAPNASPVKATKGPTVEGITEYTLPNGLRFLLFPDSSKPTTTVNMTYLVGSRSEGYGETGMAHLLEHMVFKGTPKHRNIPQELTEHGSRPNGTTAFDRTNYFETFPASAENLDWALDLEADRMVNSYIAKQDLESEMTVVRNEFEAGENSPFNVLFQRTMSTAFLWHNYGHATIGARADIENVPIERLQGFYRKYYQPDNAMLIVAGKFDPGRALQLIEEKFGSIPRPSRMGASEIFATYTAEPPQDGERLVTLRRVGDVQGVMGIYHIPAGSHPDFPALSVLGRVLADEPSGRLYKALVDTRLAARIGAFAWQLREPGVLWTYAEVRKENSVDSARTALSRTVDDLVTRPPTAEEVERAKTWLVKNIELTLNNSEIVGLWLSEWASLGDWRLLFLYRDRLKSVTVADVQRVATTYLKADNRTVGLYYPTEKPDRAEMPATPDVAALVKDYRGDTALAVGEAFDPSPANIEARTTRITLPSGFKLALLPKKTRGRAVFVTLNLRYGSEQTLMNRGSAAGLVARMLLRGTTSKSRQQIQDDLDRLRARVFFFGNPTSAGGGIETTRDNLPAVLRLVGEVLRHPAFDAKEFAALKQEELASREQQKSEPPARAFTAFNRHLNPWPKGHPRYVETIDEQIANLAATSLDDAKKFYADFYGATGEMAVVGDFDANQVRGIASEMFGAWKSAQPYRRIPLVYRDVPAANVTLETPDKAMAFFVAGQNLNLRDDDPDYPALVLGNYLLGGGFLNSRLAARIRQKDGISYGVWSSLSADPFDRAGAFQAGAIYAPENRDKLEAAVREEIDRALRDGFASEEVAKDKDGYLQSRQLSRAQDRDLASNLASSLFVGRTLTFDAQLEQKIAALSPQDIVAALRCRLDWNKMSVVKAGDFAKKKPSAGTP